MYMQMEALSNISPAEGFLYVRTLDVVKLSVRVCLSRIAHAALMSSARRNIKHKVNAL